MAGGLVGLMDDQFTPLEDGGDLSKLSADRVIHRARSDKAD